MVNTKGLDIEQDFVPCIVLVTMVPFCHTLQKSFLETFPVIAVNHWLLFFFSQTAHMQDTEICKLGWSLLWEGGTKWYLKTLYVLPVFRAVWLQSCNVTSNWALVTGILLISSSHGSMESAFCLGFPACQDFFSPAVFLREATFSLPSCLFALSSLFMISSSILTFFSPLPLQRIAYLNKGLVLLICYFHVSYSYPSQWNFYIILLLAGSSINYCQERH